MYEKILVPLDGSKLAERILPYARTLAKRLKIPAELLTVIHPETAKLFSDPAHGRYIDTVEADMQQNGIVYLGSIARTFPDPKNVACTARVGHAAEVIADQASATRTLIAMSTHGRGGVQRWLLGSVADKILHATKNDLLLVRPNKAGEISLMATLDTVVLPLDGSALADKAVRGVVELAKAMNLAVILLRVFSPPVSAYYGSDAYVPDIQQLTVPLREEAKRFLDERRERLQAEGLKDVSTVLLEGDASAQIIDYAANTPNNLVAMCTHGRSGIGRWIMGSVTERVVRHSGDPVLIIRVAP